MSACYISIIRWTRLPLILIAAIAHSALLLPPDAALAENRADTLGVLVSRLGPAGLCYRRAYDSNQLKRHVDQTISGMTVLLKLETVADAAQSFNLYAAIDLRNDPDRRYGMATSWWETGANLFGGRKQVLPILESNYVTLCMSGVDPNSAEEAGELVLGIQEAGHALLVFNGIFQMRSGAPSKRVMRDVIFGKEDRILKLKRVESHECSGIDQILAEPVRHQHR